MYSERKYLPYVIPLTRYQGFVQWVNEQVMPSVHFNMTVNCRLLAIHSVCWLCIQLKGPCNRMRFNTCSFTCAITHMADHTISRDMQSHKYTTKSLHQLRMATMQQHRLTSYQNTAPLICSHTIDTWQL